MIFGTVYVSITVSWRKTLQTRANTVSKTRGLEDFVEKNAEHGAKCRLDSFAGCRPRYLKFPSLGGTHGANRFKSSDWEDPEGEPTRTAVMCSTPPFATVPNQKSLRCGRPPHAKRGEYSTIAYYRVIYSSDSPSDFPNPPPFCQARKFTDCKRRGSSFGGGSAWPPKAKRKESKVELWI